MITAIFENNQLVSYSLKTWQYDYGQILRIEGLNLPTAVEIHFALTEKGGESVTRIGMTKDGVTDVVIPDSFLENNDITQDYQIYAFIYLRDDTSGQTEYKIPISVTSRPKPEAFDRPEDGEIFKEAIQAVRESADQAAESARQAELIKDSVQDMVDTIGSIDEQVQAVKEFAQKAETASSNAALSESRAKESKTAAETAKESAETAAESARQSATAVETARQEVAKNKTAVEQAVSGFDEKVAQSSTAIESAKTEAVKAVEDKGNEVLQSIPEDFTTQMQSKLDKNQGAENAGKILEIGIDGMVVPSDKPSGGGEKWRVIKEFTIPQDLNLEPSDVKYLVSDDGRITQFGVALDFENKPLELKKVFFSIKKEVQFYDFEVLTNVLFRYNTFAGNYNLLQFYRHCSQTTKSIFGEIEKIGKYIKATASTFGATTDYSWASDTDKNVYVYNGIPENENITEICVSIPGSTDTKPDFRGATVTILGVDA